MLHVQIYENLKKKFFQRSAVEILENRENGVQNTIGFKYLVE